VGRKIVQFMLRMPEDIWSEMKSWAAEEERSLHAQIIYVLKRALREWRD
jgi:hypothetical protein